MIDTEAPNVHAAPDRPIVIFGGSFDPPHRRHVEIAQGADAILKAKQLLVIPAKQNPQRADGPKASAADRMAMCTLAFDGLEDTVVLPIEMVREVTQLGARSFLALDAVQRALAGEHAGG